MRKHFYRIIFLIVIVCIGAVVVTKYSDEIFTKSKKIYNYGIDIGSLYPNEMYFGKGNYFYKYNDQGEVVPIVTFPQFYARFEHIYGLGTGAQGVSISNKAEIPDGIMLYWFSPFEDKLWRARVDFDQKLLQSYIDLEYYSAKDNAVIKNISEDKMFSFFVNLGPEGRAAVWIKGLLIATPQAVEVDMEKNWPDYYIAGWEKSRQELIERRVSFLDETDKKLYREGKLATAERWDRLMKQYSWEAIGNQHFNIKYIFASYSNGERYHLYDEKKAMIKDIHAVPVSVSAYIESTDEKKQYELLWIGFDEEEILNAFETISKNNPGEKIQLKLSPNRNLTEVDVFLKAGRNIIEIKNIKAQLRAIR